MYSNLKSQAIIYLDFFLDPVKFKISRFDYIYITKKDGRIAEMTDMYCDSYIYDHLVS